MSAARGDKGDYTRLWNMSVDLPDPASPPVPLCWITRVCNCLLKSVREKSAAHESAALNESSTVDPSSSVTMYGAPERNLTTLTVIDVPVQVAILGTGGASVILLIDEP